MGSSNIKNSASNANECRQDWPGKQPGKTGKKYPKILANIATIIHLCISAADAELDRQTDTPTPYADNIRTEH